jgi:hypothetical protein
VTDVVVKALGSEWHANCFCCLVSQNYTSQRQRLFYFR